MNIQKPNRFLIHDIKMVPKEVLPHFVTQPYIEQLWTTIAYNILMEYLIENSLDRQLDFANNSPYINKSICLRKHVEYPFLEAFEEFKLHRVKEKSHVAIFYTLKLKTALTNEIKDFIIKELLKINMAVNQTKMVLFAIVTPELEWYIGVITIEGNITINKSGFSERGHIDYSFFYQREDIFEWIIDRKG